MTKLGKRRRLFSKITRHVFLLGGALVFMFPLYWLISTSLKHEKQIFVLPPQLIPNPVIIDNYTRMWRHFPFLKFLSNTGFVTAMGVVGVLVSAPMVAYAFARLRWPGRNLWFMVMMATMMIPSQVTMIPLYIIFKEINWIDTFLPLWVPAWFGGGAFSIFLVRQFLMTTPKEMEESAFIDGANYLQIYIRIMLPLVYPPLTTIAIFRFMNSWNDFMGPLIYINNQNKYTLSLGLRLFQQQTGTAEYGMMMAATVLMVLPVILFFFLGQKQFIEGVVLTGMKN
ncbi:MAG: carbohydrate ABC transporter permease [Oscillospiraceae bacterium]|nr:carbohydrate ABC transporter permease [Oscillospiraceae bacterium]